MYMLKPGAPRGIFFVVAYAVGAAITVALLLLDPEVGADWLVFLVPSQLLLVVITTPLYLRWARRAPAEVTSGTGVISGAPALPDASGPSEGIAGPNNE